MCHSKSCLFFPRIVGLKLEIIITSCLQVLDMCAAPGSKTFQLLEMLHGGEPDVQPTGFVIANDVEFRRCNLLVHQIKRVCSPSLIITTHDAARYPFPKPKEEGHEVCC